MRNSKSKHRGVTGLISVITLLFVFSFATAALLQVEAKQVSLVNTISDKIIIQSQSASEKLIPTFVQCIENPPGIFSATFLLENNWEENSKLDSVLFFKKQSNVIQNVTGASYITEQTNKTIFAQTDNLEVSVSISGTPILNIGNSTHAIFVSDLGNKFTVEDNFSC
ncbi:MAG: hypothetical protein ACE5GR_07835 [Nitrosopumilus sp.]